MESKKLKKNTRLCYFVLSFFIVLLMIPNSYGSFITKNDSSNQIDCLDFKNKIGPHLSAQIGGNTSNFVISEESVVGDIYDTSMKNFFNLDDCHGVADGSGVVIMVIDTPIDHRHDIWDQEGYDSLDPNDCYLIECDFGTNEATGIVQAPAYTGDFADNFNDYYHYPEFLATDVYHGTAVAGLVKQVAPWSKIISMGALAAIGDVLVDTHIMALQWAKNYIDTGNSLDIITISSYGDAIDDDDLNDDFEAIVLQLKARGVLFTMATDETEGHSMATDQLYGAMGNNPGIIGVGRIYDEGDNAGKRGDNAHNYANHPDFMDLELMASGFSLRSASPVVDGETNLDVNFLSGNSFSTPIVAGTAALLMDYYAGDYITNEDTEELLQDLAIHPSNYDYDPEYDEDWYKMYYGYGILNIAGALNVGDFDDDGLGDYDEFYEYGTDMYDVDSDDDGILDGEEVILGSDGFITNPNDDDSDDDGILDGEEVVAGADSYITNPLDDDTDDDLVLDGDEIALLLDPTNPDWDDDGLLDGEELYTYNTDPKDSDSEDDGLNDGAEVNIYFTDPLDVDSDDDGLCDGEEVYGYLTSPTDPDTDGDWLKDGEEVYTYDTEPLTYDTDGDGWWDGFEVYNSQTDPLVLDTDSDGLEDKDEFDYWVSLGLDSTIAYSYCRDSDVDNDSLSDGDELTLNCDPLDSDSDNDGLLDGHEVHTHNTNPLLSDTDSDGMYDKFEVDYDFNPLFDDASGDYDHDGLTNIEEQNILTDPKNSDTDGDGLPDGWEVTYGLNPRLEDALSDLDGDNMNNLLEFQRGTDPSDPDCDNDGLNDRQEIFIYTTNPWDSDTDDDGLLDGYEVIYLGTDPAVGDTDADGLLDGEEMILGDDGFITDPLDPDTDDDSLLDGEEYTHSTNPLNSDTDSDSFDDYQEIFTYSTDPLDYNSNPAGFSPNICRNFYGLPDGISKVYFTWNAPTNYWAGNAQWSAWKYVLKVKIGTTWTTKYSGTSRSFNYEPEYATTSYSYRLYCYNQHTGVYSIYLSWYGAAKSSGGGGGPM